LEFSTVEESPQGSSATDSLSGDVTDGWKEEVRQRIRKGGFNGCNGCQSEVRRKKEEGRRKKEESFLKLAMPNASFRPNYQFPMTNNQFPKQIGGALRPPTN